MEKKSFISIAIWLTIANILGKLLGFGKDILISYHYGTSDATDALFLAMSIPLVVLGIFTSAADSSIIPQYNRLFIKEGRKSADQNFSNIINVFMAIGIIFSFLVLLFPNSLLNIFAPGFNETQNSYAIKFLRLFSFFGFFHILYCYFTAYSVRYQHVVVRSILSFSTNLLVILVLLIIPDKKMISLSIAFFIGYFIQGFLPVFGVRKLGYKHKWRINLKDAEYKQYWHIFMPILITALIRNLHTFVDNYIASGLGSGGISSLNYASRLTSIFDTMIVVGIGVAILPKLSNLNIKGQTKQYIHLSTLLVKYMIVLLLPVMLILMLLSKEIVEVVYFRGEFSIKSVEVVSVLLLLFAPRVLFLPLQAIIVRLFHAQENTRTPLLGTSIGVSLNIILSILFSKIWGLNGIAIATSIAIFLTNLLLVYLLIRKIGWDYKIFRLRDILIILLSSVGLIAITILMNLIGFKGLSKVFLVSIIGATFYFCSIYLFMYKELQGLLGVIRGKINSNI